MVDINLGMAVERYGLAQVIAWILVDVAALNWGLVEVFDVNLVTEFLPADWAAVAYMVIGVAGLIGLVETVTDVEVLGK